MLGLVLLASMCAAGPGQPGVATKEPDCRRQVHNWLAEWPRRGFEVEIYNIGDPVNCLKWYWTDDDPRVRGVEWVDVPQRKSYRVITISVWYRCSVGNECCFRDFRDEWSFWYSDDGVLRHSIWHAFMSPPYYYSNHSPYRYYFKQDDQ